MSTHDEHAHEHHGPSYGMYIFVFSALLLLTGLTVATARPELMGDSIPASMAVPVALAIAALKAGLVISIFMHVGWSSPLVKTFALMGFFFLFILASFFWTDFGTRSWNPSNGWEDSGVPEVTREPEIRWNTTRP